MRSGFKPYYPEFSFHTWGQNDYTHILSIWEFIPNYTGQRLHMAFWQELFCVIWALMQAKTHSNYLGINYLITHIGYANYLCDHFGPHGSGSLSFGNRLATLLAVELLRHLGHKFTNLQHHFRQPIFNKRQKNTG